MKLREITDRLIRRMISRLKVHRLELKVADCCRVSELWKIGNEREMKYSIM